MNISGLTFVKRSDVIETTKESLQLCFIKDLVREMTLAVQDIKAKILDLPPLSLPRGSGQLIIETDASSHTWGGVLLEVIEDKDHVCGYVLGSFKAAELNYPSSHKEIFTVKKAVPHFICF